MVRLGVEWFAQVAHWRKKLLLAQIPGEKERAMLQKASLGNWMKISCSEDPRNWVLPLSRRRAVIASSKFRKDFFAGHALTKRVFAPCVESRLMTLNSTRTPMFNAWMMGWFRHSLNFWPSSRLFSSPIELQWSVAINYISAARHCPRCPMLALPRWFFPLLSHSPDTDYPAIQSSSLTFSQFFCTPKMIIQ